MKAADDTVASEPTGARQLLADVAVFLEQFVDQPGYGFFCGGDPRRFSPDPECSTEEEREAHRLACAAWERGERVDAHVGCTATVGFGLGSYTLSDESAAELLARIRAETGGAS